MDQNPDTTSENVSANQESQPRIAAEGHSALENFVPEGNPVPGNNSPEGHSVPQDIAPEGHPLAILQGQLSRHWPPRILVYLTTILTIYLQIICMYLLLFFVPTIDGIYVIWACPQRGNLIFSSWLLTALVSIGFIRAKYEMQRAFPKPLIITLSKLPRGPDEEAGIAIPLSTMMGARDNQGMYDSYRYMGQVVLTLTSGCRNKCHSNGIDHTLPRAFPTLHFAQQKLLEGVEAKVVGATPNDPYIPFAW